jgi:FkbM family methyltransferase
VNIFERVFAEPELREDPPVLVDVGAAGGVHPAWRRIARYAVGVGFEPDAREAAPLDAAQREFRRWIFCPGLAVPERPAEGTATLHLTKSPQCSSTLPPRTAALAEWSFAEFFEVTERRQFPATTLTGALAAQGITGVDWLKCDTQGLDLKLWQSLPAGWRSRVLAVEVEPGIIDAYDGEEKLGDVLAARRAGTAGKVFGGRGGDVGAAAGAGSAGVGECTFSPGFRAGDGDAQSARVSARVGLGDVGASAQRGVDGGGRGGGAVWRRNF